MHSFSTDDQHIPLLADAAERLGAAREQLTIRCWLQTFRSTNLGFPGVGGQMLTDGEVCVIRASEFGRAAVYVGNRLAYVVRRPNAAFEEAVAAQHLAGAANYDGRYDDTPQAPQEQFGVLEAPRIKTTSFERALDEAYMIAAHEMKRATVVRISDQAVAACATPDGKRSAEIELTPLGKSCCTSAKHPRIGR